MPDRKQLYPLAMWQTIGKDIYVNTYMSDIWVRWCLGNRYLNRRKMLIDFFYYGKRNRRKLNIYFTSVKEEERLAMK